MLHTYCLLLWGNMRSEFHILVCTGADDSTCGWHLGEFELCDAAQGTIFSTSNSASNLSNSRRRTKFHHSYSPATVLDRMRKSKMEEKNEFNESPDKSTFTIGNILHLLR